MPSTLPAALPPEPAGPPTWPVSQWLDPSSLSTVAAGPELDPGAVRVWISGPVGHLSHWTPSLLQLLTDDERATRSALRFARDQELYVTAHALARVALSQVLATAPTEGLIIAGRHARPVVVDRPDLDLSLSHTPGLVAVAIGRMVRCGVDVERTEARPALQTAVLGPLEEAAVRTDPAHAAEAFARYWTLKEAISKAVGRGLAMPFKQVQVTPLGVQPTIIDGHEAIERSGVAETTPKRAWALAHQSLGGPPPHWSLAVATCTDQASPSHIELW